MADLTLRAIKGSPLTNAELDGNFEYFTGSHAITGSLSISGSFSFEGGSTIQSIPTSSGDGYGFSTLELTPDASLGTDQYIVLDPTTPNHIHVRAGGVIDESTAYLYLGGEKANVLVTDFNHQVQISTTTEDSSSLEWIFDNKGNTLFPRLTTPIGEVNSGTLETNTLRLGDGTNSAVITTPNGILPDYPSEGLILNPGQGSGSGAGGDIYLWAGRGGENDGYGGNIGIHGGYGLRNGYGGYVLIEGGNTRGGRAGLVEIKGGDSITSNGGSIGIKGGIGNGNTQNGEVRITTYNTSGSSNDWRFSTKGTLIIPDLLQLPVRTTDPGSPAEGMIMASGSAGSSQLFYYNGTAWVDLTA